MLPVLGGGFVLYDDPDYVTKNEHVRAGVTLSGLAWAATSFDASNWHPLTWVSHMLDAAIHGGRPWGHHLTSLLLHVATAVLLFLVLEAATGRAEPSAWAAAMFGVHPAHVESVAWIAERKDVLSGLFFVLTLAAYVAHVRRPGRFTFAAVIGAFACGLLAKPMLVTLPFVLLLLDVWPLGRRPRETWRSLVTEKAPLLALSAVSCALTLAAQSRGRTLPSLTHLSLGARLENALVALAAYLRIAVWPTNLACFYPYPAGGWPGSRVAVSAAVLLALTAGAVALRRRAPSLATGWAWYLGMLVPVAGIVQVGSQAMADRYTYLPFVGLFVAAAWLVPPRAPRTAWILAWIAVAALIPVSRAQARVWRDSVTLFEHAARVTADNAFAAWSLGAALAAEGRTGEAIASYERSIRIDPGYAEAHNNLGILLAKQGRLDEAAARYREAIRRRPAYAQAHRNLGHALDRLGRTGEALAEYESAIRIDPGKAEAYDDAGGALIALGRPAEAVERLAAAIRLAPGNGRAHANLASALHELGRDAEAREEIRRARAAGFEPPPALVEAIPGAKP